MSLMKRMAKLIQQDMERKANVSIEEIESKIYRLQNEINKLQERQIRMINNNSLSDDESWIDVERIDAEIMNKESEIKKLEAELGIF